MLPGKEQAGGFHVQRSAGDGIILCDCRHRRRQVANPCTGKAAKPVVSVPHNSRLLVGTDSARATMC